LEDYCSIAKYEVNGAIDVALPVKLALCMGHEGVLEAHDGAPVEDGEIGGRPERHRLSLLSSGSVLEGHVPCNEVETIYA